MSLEALLLPGAFEECPHEMALGAIGAKAQVCKSGSPPASARAQALDDHERCAAIEPPPHALDARKRTLWTYSSGACATTPARPAGLVRRRWRSLRSLNRPRKP